MSERLGTLRGRLRSEALQHSLSPRDVDIFLGDALGMPLTRLIANDDRLISDEIVGLVLAVMKRRLAGEPLQYIRGRTEFFGRQFLVDDRVLIPRPETELLVEAALRYLPPKARVLDLGTGSGCIAVTLAKERDDLEMFASDSSVAALAVATRNARLLEARVRFLGGRTLEPLRGVFDGVVSNPPYIAAAELQALQVEVRGHEPRGALTPGESGLEVIEVILSDAGRCLGERGVLLLEVGFGQAEEIERRARKAAWETLEVLDDLAGIPRVVVLRRS